MIGKTYKEHDRLYVPAATETIFSPKVIDDDCHNSVEGYGHNYIFRPVQISILFKLYSLLGSPVYGVMKRKEALTNFKRFDSSGNPLHEETRQAVFHAEKSGPKKVYWNLFHASHADASRLRYKPTAKAMGVQLTGAFKSCE